MKKLLLTGLALFFTLCLQIQATPENTTTTLSQQAQSIDEVWNDFRKCHPLPFQTVAMKHLEGDEYLVIISEPDNNISETELAQLFKTYQGTYEVKKTRFGYDGWLADVVAIVHLTNDYMHQQFNQKLFKMLYGTDYKAYYTDLDSASGHCYYSHDKLNYSITAAELYTWLIKEKEGFVPQKGGDATLLIDLLNNSQATGLYYSQKPGFVIWIFNTSNYGSKQSEFRGLARTFTLDADFIVGAIGTKGKRVAVVGRERQVPVDVLPPLRIETMKLLASSENESLAQSYERNHVFGGKTSQQQDVAPIYLSDELWNTEYGNLLNVTDQMLKSWSENGKIDYINFSFYPKPIDWAFTRGAIIDMQTDELTYNWNTAGAGYVVPGDGDIEVFSVNRTGSLPVSYIPTGMEGKAPDNVVEAEELAYDFFSGLNNPELTRVVQYATLYQIFQYFRPEKVIGNLSLPSMLPAHAFKPVSLDGRAYEMAPTYKQHETIVERLLRIAANPDGKEMTDCYEASLNRYYEKMRAKNNVSARLTEYIQNDPYGYFVNFLVREKGQDYVDKIESHHVTRAEAKEAFEYALRQNLDTVHAFIASYEQQYGSFPTGKAAHMVVNSRKAIDELQEREDNIYNGPEKQSLIQREEELEKSRIELNKRIDKYNASNALLYDPILEADIASYRTREAMLSKDVDEYKKKVEKEENVLLKEYSLYRIAGYSKSIGALNWLLTDPGKYDEPVGAFFAQYMNTQGKWAKSPSIVSSKGQSGGYGGHNLDAKVTRVRVDPNMRSGQSRVVMENGKRVVMVSAADRSKVTTATLREIERKDITGNYTLPKQAPVIRQRTAFIGEPSAYSTTVRGFRPEVQANVKSMVKRVYFNDVEKSSTQDMLKEVVDQVLTEGKSGKVRLEHYSEQEVRVLADNMQERIMERSADMQISLENFDVNAITVEPSSTDPSVVYINIPEKMGVPKMGSYQEAGLELQIPSNIPQEKVVNAVKSLYELPMEKIDNRTKWMHELKRSLEEIPELHIDDVHDDYYMIYSFIFRLDNNGNRILLAA